MFDIFPLILLNVETYLGLALAAKTAKSYAIIQPELIKNGNWISGHVLIIYSTYGFSIELIKRQIYLLTNWDYFVIIGKQFQAESSSNHAKKT